MDVEPTTRDDETILTTCNHLANIPLTNDSRLSDRIYQSFNDALDQDNKSDPIDRDALLAAAAETESADTLDALLAWYDQFAATVDIEVSRSSRGSIKFRGSPPARDNHYPPIHVDVTLSTQIRPTVQVHGHRFPGTEKHIWSGTIPELNHEVILSEAADSVMPSVVSRVAELQEECGLRGRRAETVALKEAGWTGDQVRDELPVASNGAIRGYKSKAQTATRAAERLLVTRTGTPKTILADTEITAGGGFPRRYYVCEAVGVRQGAFLVTVEGKDAGPSVTTLDYDDLATLVDAHESEAEFLGWDTALHDALDASTNN